MNFETSFTQHNMYYVTRLSYGNISKTRRLNLLLNISLLTAHRNLMVRILHTADIHLGSPIRSIALRNPDLGERLKQASRDTFVRVVSLAIEEQVDALVLAGDIFDNAYPDLRSRAFLISQLSRASEAGVPTVLIRGNHDALLDHNAHGDLGSNIHLLHKNSPTVEIGNTAFHGLSFDKAHVAKSFLPDYPTPIAGKYNVGLMHTSLDGAQGHDPYAPCAAQDLIEHGYNLWCLGHIHAPSEQIDGNVMLVMPGIPQPRHFGERKGGTVTLISLGEGAPKFERRNVAQLGFSERTLDLQSCTDQQEVLRNLRKTLMAEKVADCDIAVRLHVTSDRYNAEWVAEFAAEVLDNIEGVFLDKVKSTPAQGTSDGQTDELVHLMYDEILEEGFRQAALLELEELRSVLPSEIAGEFEENALDAFLKEAINEVSLTLNSGGRHES